MCYFRRCSNKYKLGLDHESLEYYNEILTWPLNSNFFLHHYLSQSIVINWTQLSRLGASSVFLRLLIHQCSTSWQAQTTSVYYVPQQHCTLYSVHTLNWFASTTYFILSMLVAVRTVTSSREGAVPFILLPSSNTLYTLIKKQTNWLMFYSYDQEPGVFSLGNQELYKFNEL